jgi:hypothetical protein
MRADVDCDREPDILDALATRRLASDAELQRHLRECDACADVAEVACVLLEERQSACDAAPVPAADVVWVRAQRRARVEAARLSVRPIAVVQALGVACSVGAVAGMLGAAAWWLRSWMTWLSSAAGAMMNGPSSLEMAALASRGILLALAVWLVIAPVAVYLAATED